MKTMSSTLLLSLLLVTTAFAQATTTLNQTFSAMNATALHLDVASPDVTVKSTKGSRIIVESVIRLSTSNDRLLQFVVQSGRYHLSPSYDASQSLLCLQRDREQTALIVRGEEVLESVRYTVYLPEMVRYAKKAVHTTIQG